MIVLPIWRIYDLRIFRILREPSRKKEWGGAFEHLARSRGHHPFSCLDRAEKSLLPFESIEGVNQAPRPEAEPERENVGHPSTNGTLPALGRNSSPLPRRRKSRRTERGAWQGRKGHDPSRRKRRAPEPARRRTAFIGASWSRRRCCSAWRSWSTCRPWTGPFYGMTQPRS